MLRQRWLVRGESVIAPIGISVAAILLAVIVALAWWNLRTHRAFNEAARIDQVKATSDLLAQSAEALLAADELTSARRLLVEAARIHDLTGCRIVLPDGQVIADADPLRITAHKLPDRGHWPVAPHAADPGPLATDDRFLTLRYPLLISGRGDAILQITAAVDRPSYETWPMLAGAGVVGVVGLAGLLLVYRKMRTRVQALGVIREAFLAIGRGEAARAALVVYEDLGPEALIWNRLLTEREELKEQLLSRRVDQSLSAERGRGADLDSACDAMWQGVIVIDEHLRVRYVNGAAAVFLRESRDGIIGADATEKVKDPRVIESIRSAVAGCALRGNTVEVESGPAGTDGGGLLRFSVRPIRRGESRGAIVIIEDITQQRVAEEARNTFVAHATHELRMPLTNIRLYLETALDEGEKDPTLRGKCLNVINQETKRLERLVGDILSVSQIEAGSLTIERDDVRLDALFNELEADYQARAQDKQIALVFNLPPKLPVIQGDRSKIVLALQNLVGNAIKYTPAGGQVQVNVETDAKQLTVEVKDTGIGISDQDAKRIFDKFYRADDPRVSETTGSGLGLALAREVIRLHGGDITAESQINAGSMFALTLPIVSEAA